MKFLKKLARKSPEEKITEDLLVMEFSQASIFFPDKFTKIKLETIVKVVNQLTEDGKLNGEFVGNKGWFLFDSEKRYEEIWDKLLKGPVNLSEISKMWGNFGNKRVFIALENYGSQKKMPEPVFTRKENVVYLNAYILQEWNDAVNKFDLEEDDIAFERITEQVNSNIRDIVSEIAKASFVERKTDLLLGSDNIVRRRNSINNYLAEYISNALEDSSNSEIHYEEIAVKFGLTEEEVSTSILKLIDDKEIENITNYPIDGFIKSR